MKSAIKARFDDTRLARVLECYSLQSGYKLLSAWHAFTYEVFSGEKSYILRITYDTHRTQEKIEAELEWMEFAGSGGVKVPAVIPSIHGRQTELVDAGPSQFTAVLFEKVDGRAVAEGDWNPSFFRQWGGIVGRLHHLSAQFRPVKHRPQWHESDFLNIASYIPDELGEIKRTAYELLEEVRALSHDRHSFGLIHADVYQDNILISNGGLQLIDFDNSEYGFFVSDLANSIYAALWRLKPEEDRQAFAERFWKDFLRGYRDEFHLDSEQLARIPLFLRLRELLIYIVARKKLDLSNLTLQQARNLQERGKRIATRIPVVDLNGLVG